MADGDEELRLTGLDAAAPYACTCGELGRDDISLCVMYELDGETYSADKLFCSPGHVPSPADFLPPRATIIEAILVVNGVRSTVIDGRITLTTLGPEVLAADTAAFERIQQASVHAAADAMFLEAYVDPSAPIPFRLAGLQASLRADHRGPERRLLSSAGAPGDSQGRRFTSLVSTQLHSPNY